MDAELEKLAERIALVAARELVEQFRREGLPPPAEYLSARDAGLLLGFSEKAMERMRQRGEGPKFAKLGKIVRYRITDLREWAERGAVVA